MDGASPPFGLKTIRIILSLCNPHHYLNLYRKPLNRLALSTVNEVEQEKSN